MNKFRISIVTALMGSACAVYACGGTDSSSVTADGGVDGAAPLSAADSGKADGAAGADAGVVTDAGGLCPSYNVLKNPYFGDLHAHTAYSLDAYSFATRNTPFDAYAFARGETLQVAGASPDGGGPNTTIKKPLDFLAVTDHSEWLAASYGCGTSLADAAFDPASPYFNSADCQLVRSTDPSDQDKVFAGMNVIRNALCDGGQCGPVIASAWQSEQQAAAAAYIPCEFTSLIAYEWTHEAAGATLHKNVVFANTNVPAAPLDSANYATQLDMWNGLESQCSADAGCTALTIPHNSNLSQGGAFDIPDGGESLAIKYQKLVEVIQHKGGSECFYDPADASADPDCNFEYLGGVTEPNLPASYVRDGLKMGIRKLATSGQNPLELGFVGATDDHNGTPGNTNESTFPGHLGRNDDTAAARITEDDGGVGVDVGHNPGGLTGVWAEQNTRDSIFAALSRRETFATSGTRILVRFYQTWGTDNPCADPSFPAAVVAGGGVPMGGTFGAAPADAGSAAPSFVVSAWKDEADLARIDIIKAWVDGDGTVQQTIVHNAASSGAHACVFWQDPSFKAGPAFYYARVMEVPTPRWSTYDCANAPLANPTQCAPGGTLNVQIQERAWTSPIWYRP